MTSIDTSRWGEFPLAELFEMKNTKSITARLVVPDSGSTPYVTAKEGNNGVHTYVSCPEEWLELGDCILIGGKTLAISYQADGFCSNDSHNIALYLREPEHASVEVQLFLVAVLRATFSDWFSWGDSISLKRAKELSALLPQTASGAPDWEYMKRTMRGIMSQREAALDHLRAFTLPSQ